MTRLCKTQNTTWHPHSTRARGEGCAPFLTPTGQAGAAAPRPRRSSARPDGRAAVPGRVPCAQGLARLAVSPGLPEAGRAAGGAGAPGLAALPARPRRPRRQETRAPPERRRAGGAEEADPGSEGATCHCRHRFRRHGRPGAHGLRGGARGVLHRPASAGHQAGHRRQQPLPPPLLRARRRLPTRRRLRRLRRGRARLLRRPAGLRRRALRGAGRRARRRGQEAGHAAGPRRRAAAGGPRAVPRSRRLPGAAADPRGLRAGAGPARRALRAVLRRGRPRDRRASQPLGLPRPLPRQRLLRVRPGGRVLPAVPLPVAERARRRAAGMLRARALLLRRPVLPALRAPEQGAAPALCRHERERLHRPGSAGGVLQQGAPASGLRGGEGREAPPPPGTAELAGAVCGARRGRRQRAEIPQETPEGRNTGASLHFDGGLCSV